MFRRIKIFRDESSNPLPPHLNFIKKKFFFTSVFVTHGEMKKTVSLMLGFAMKHPVKKPTTLRLCPRFFFKLIVPKIIIFFLLPE